MHLTRAAEKAATESAQLQNRVEELADAHI